MLPGCPSRPLRPLHGLGLSSELFEHISFFPFFSLGLFPRYKSISSSQGEKNKSPPPSVFLWGLQLCSRMLIGHLLHGQGGSAAAWGSQEKEGTVQTDLHPALSRCASPHVIFCVHRKCEDISVCLFFKA